MTMEIRGGAVVLSRSSDGRARVIHPPGRIVDAELEDSGLFYAYNLRGPMPGNVVFVPFAELLG